jgi:glycosyltransferase involved in cell wall biosynthesis
MLRSKGIESAVRAVQLARARGLPLELNIYGAPDPENRSSIPEATLVQWSSQPGIRWRGRTDHVAQVWRDHHVGLFLTSYREGVPRSLIEAAACGRPIIATDAVGCRDLVRDGREGLLVPPGDVASAARAIDRLAGDRPMRLRMGENAHRRFMEKFTEENIRRIVSGVYRSAARADGRAGRMASS